MAVYVVMEPDTGDLNSAQERAVFVRDGFHFLAFLFHALWLLFHRVWLAGLAVLVLIIGLTIVDTRLGLGGLLSGALIFLTQILIGLEGANWKVAALQRRGYFQWGVVEAKNKRDAELRYAALADNRPLTLVSTPWKQRQTRTEFSNAVPAQAGVATMPWER